MILRLNGLVLILFALMATGVLRLAEGLEWQDGAGYRLAKLPVPAQGKVGFTITTASQGNETNHNHYHGLTAALASALAGNEINIETLDAKKIDDIGVITLVVDQYKRALHVLNNAGWKPIEEDTMLVRVADEPGAIAHLAKRLRDSDLHIRSMRVVQHHGDWGAIAVSADPIKKRRAT